MQVIGIGYFLSEYINAYTYIYYICIYVVAAIVKKLEGTRTLKMLIDIMCKYDIVLGLSSFDSVV